MTIPAKESQRRYRAKNPGKIAETWKRWFIRKYYGLTLDDVAVMLEAQNGCCAICRSPFGNDERCIDHDHRTGKIRGLVCHRCNMGIGFLRDDPAILTSAAIYVRDGGVLKIDRFVPDLVALEKRSKCSA